MPHIPSSWTKAQLRAKLLTTHLTLLCTQEKVEELEQERNALLIEQRPSRKVRSAERRELSAQFAAARDLAIRTGHPVLVVQ